MLRVLAIVWQSYYNMFLRVSKNIKDFTLKVYSARALEQQLQKLDQVFTEMEDSDIIFLYRSNESVWEEIEKRIKEKIKIQKLYASDMTLPTGCFQMLSPIF
ncbi:MAG: hypothetical protein ABDH19_02685 [Thermodesulfovibrio sp.]